MILHAKCFTIFLLLIYSQLPAQDSTLVTEVNKKRLTHLTIASSLTYTAGMVGLHQLWYRDFERQSFRFFNDNAEWKQMDKAGHIFSAFHLSSISARTLQWTGLADHKSNLIGVMAGFAILLPIEIFDGYSAAYGASWGDLAANALGAGFFYGQQVVWNEARLQPKISFQRSPYAPLRPEVLGKSYFTELFKDYNGQTMWLSVDVDKFINFPKWLNIAFGYGAEEMVYARDEQNIANGFQPYRQFFIAIDPDLSSIRTNSKAIKTAIFFLNMIKLPAPAIEFRKGDQKLHLFYF
jgi:uncharacterized protein YfiM (DUF2279 family)